MLKEGVLTPPHAWLCARYGKGLWQLPYLYSSSLTFSDGKRNSSWRKGDGGGVNGSDTDLLPGPLWNYN